MRKGMLLLSGFFFVFQAAQADATCAAYLIWGTANAACDLRVEFSYDSCSDVGTYTTANGDPGNKICQELRDSLNASATCCTYTCAGIILTPSCGAEECTAEPEIDGCGIDIVPKN